MDAHRRNNTTGDRLDLHAHPPEPHVPDRAGAVSNSSHVVLWMLAADTTCPASSSIVMSSPPSAHAAQPCFVMLAAGATFPANTSIFTRLPPSQSLGLRRLRSLRDACGWNHVLNENLDLHPAHPLPSHSRRLADACRRNDLPGNSLDLHGSTSYPRIEPTRRTYPFLWMLAAGTASPVSTSIFMPRPPRPSRALLSPTWT